MTPIERIAELKRPFWIGYTTSIVIRQRLDDLLTHPKSHRMPNLALIGESNNGKSMLLHTWRAKYPPLVDPNRPAELPLFYVEMPPECDEARFYTEALATLGLYGSPREPIDDKLTRFRVQLTNLKTRALIIDEFNHAIVGSPKKQRQFLNAIKSLGNHLKIPIIASGTEQALNALQSDPQLANRFHPAFLPRWKMGDEFLSLLATIKQTLKLENPYTISKATCAAILDESDGLIGDIVNLMTNLVVQSISDGTEVLSPLQLRPDNLKKIGWRKPSQRTRFVD